MSPAPALRQTVSSAADRKSDPRIHPRYPIALDLQYKILKGRTVEHLGGGRSLNISRGGVLFEPNDFPEISDIADESGTIELAIDWPLLLNKVCAMKLVVRGRIVRRETKRLALKIDKHEFRTAGVKTIAKASYGAV
jgi:hypothetical protein